MPNRDPEKVKEAKHRWYLKHREEIAARKREQRAAKKKLKPPKPPKPPPTPEQIARARELNRLACNRYRAGHLSQVRALNRDYYHRHRDRIVQQQRDRGAAEGGETQKCPVSEKLDAKNEGGGDVRGVQAAIKCAAAEVGGREKACAG